MTTQHIYTPEEHEEAEKNRLLADILKAEIEKGAFYYFGKAIRSVDDFIVTSSMLNPR